MIALKHRRTHSYAFYHAMYPEYGLVTLVRPTFRTDYKMPGTSSRAQVIASNISTYVAAGSEQEVSHNQHECKDKSVIQASTD